MKSKPPAHDPALKEVVRAAYTTGTAGLRELARQHGLPPATILAWAHRENWSNHRAHTIAKTRNRLQSSMAERAERFLDQSTTLGSNLLAAVDGHRGKVASARDLRELAMSYADLTKAQLALFGIGTTPGVTVQVGILTSAFGSGDVDLDLDLPDTSTSTIEGPEAGIEA